MRAFIAAHPRCRCQAHMPHSQLPPCPTPPCAPDWAIVTGGRPNRRSNGACATGSALGLVRRFQTNNVGLWLFSRKPIDPVNTQVGADSMAGCRLPAAGHGSWHPHRKGTWLQHGAAAIACWLPCLLPSQPGTIRTTRLTLHPSSPPLPQPPAADDEQADRARTGCLWSARCPAAGLRLCLRPRQRPVRQLSGDGGLYGSVQLVMHCSHWLTQRALHPATILDFV